MLVISGNDADWVEPLKEKLSHLSSSVTNERLWLVAHEENGTIGLANCLRKEEYGDKIR